MPATLQLAPSVFSDIPTALSQNLLLARIQISLFYSDKCGVLGSIRKLRAKYVFTFPVAAMSPTVIIGKYFWYKFHKGILKMFTVTYCLQQLSLIYPLKITEAAGGWKNILTEIEKHKSSVIFKG